MKFIKIATSTLLACAAFAACGAWAGTDEVKKEVEKRFPDVKVDRVTKTVYGLYEVFLGTEIVYTDEAVNFLITGSLIDAATRTNVTEARINKLLAVKFADLPFQQAIKLVRGNGQRQLAVFEDPNCGYCKRFEKDLNSMDNITAYIFPYAILAEDSTDKAKSIWCSPDRLRAWQDQLMREKPPVASTSCENPVEKNYALGQKMRINGTPTMIFEDGERIPGAVSKERIEARLVEASAKIAAK